MTHTSATHAPRRALYSSVLVLSIVICCLSLTPFADAAPTREVVAPPATALPAPGSQVTALSDSSGSPAAPTVPPLDLTAASPTRPVQPALSWRLDKTGRLTPEEVLSPAQQSFFAPYSFSTLPRAAGTCWFRLDLAAYDGRNGGYYIDLNTRVQDQIPSDMRVWLVSGTSPAQVLTTDTAGLYRLPDSFAASTLFIRTAGLPALGFMPELRPAASINGLDLHGGTWLRLILAAALLLGLLRGIFEQREWRMWAALYAGALLVADVWGFPATPDGRIRLLDLPGLLAPGIALLLLPHVGRHIMRSREQATLIDFQFTIVGLVGLALTLVPLLSSHVWTVRYLPLWPLGMLLLVPTTLAALSGRIPGAGRYLWICILPPLGLVAFAPLPNIQFETPESAGIWTACLSLLPVLALAASSVLIALAPTPKHVIKAKRSAAVAVTAGGTLARPVGKPETLALSMDTPQIATPPLVLDDTSRMTPPAVTDSALPLHNLERRMRGPLDILLNEIGTFDQMKLPRELVDHAHRLSRAGRQLALLIGDISSGHHGNPVAVHDRNGMGTIPDHSAPFDLYEVILQAHNSVAEVAEAKNLSLSWFTAPHLARTYVGEGDRLARVLTLLAESAVHATDRGIVQIRVQRLPESNDPGQLLFTVSDTGKGAPPLQRSSISLVQVWELVGPGGGTLNVESGPTGTSIAFSMRLQVAGAERSVSMGKNLPEPALRTTLSSALRILVVSDVPGSRQLLTYYLDELPHEVREARSTDEVLGMYTQTPGALLIFDGDLPESDVVRTVAAIRAHEGEHDYPLSSILALAKDDEQMERLRRAGCTHTLLKPVSRTELRQLALRLAPLPKSRPQRPEPKPTAQPSGSKTTAPAATAKAETPKNDKKNQKNKGWSLLPSLQLTKDKGSSAEELEFLKTPTLDVRSNVSDPKPLPRKSSTEASRTEASRKAAADVSTTAPLPHLPGAHDVARSGMPEPVSTAPRPSRSKPAAPAAPVAPAEPAAAATVAPVASAEPAQTPGTPARVHGQGMRARINRQDGQSELMTSAEQELDDMLREAETVMVSPVNRVEQAVADEQRERRPIPWRPSARSAESALPGSVLHGDEWVGEPVPLSKPVSTGKPAPASEPVLTSKPGSVPQSTPEQNPKGGFFKSFFDVFQKKPASGPAEFASAHIPSPSEWVGEPTPIIRKDAGTEWVGEPMPIIKTPASPEATQEMPGGQPPDADSIRESFAHLPDPDPDPVAIPLAELTRTTPETAVPAAEMETTPLPDPQAETPSVPDTAQDPRSMTPEMPHDAVQDTVQDVPLEPTPVPAANDSVPAESADVSEQTPEAPAETASALNSQLNSQLNSLDPLDPLAPVMVEEPVPSPAVPVVVSAEVPVQVAEPVRVLPEPDSLSPSHGPSHLSLEPKSAAPVTRLYLPGMEPAPVGGSGGLRLVEPVSSRSDEEIFTLTDVVSDVSGTSGTSNAPKKSDLLDIHSSTSGGTADALTAGELTAEERVAEELASAELARAEQDAEDVELLLLDLKDLSQQARAAFEAGERQTLQKTATRLAGAASALGLHGLIDLALCLEEEAPTADSAAAVSLLSAIDEAVQSARL